MELLGDLAARLSAAHHEHRSVGQRSRVAVVVHVELEQVRSKPSGGGWTVRALVGAGAEHDPAGPQLAGRGLEHEATARVPPQPGDLDSALDGSVEAGRVALEIGDDLVADHEAVRVVAVVVMARKLNGPVRGDEAEAVPAAAPGLTDASALQDDVIDAPAGELMAHGEPGLAGSH